MILWILAISSGKSWIVFPATGRISARRSGLGCLIVGMAWCQMFSDVYNVSPLSEVIGRFVLPQTAACLFSKDEIRVSNPDSIHGNCSGRFRLEFWQPCGLDQRRCPLLACHTTPRWCKNIACGVGKSMIIMHRLPLTTCVIHIRRSRRSGLEMSPKTANDA